MHFTTSKLSLQLVLFNDSSLFILFYVLVLAFRYNWRNEENAIVIFVNLSFTTSFECAFIIRTSQTAYVSSRAESIGHWSAFHQLKIIITFFYACTATAFHCFLFCRYFRFFCCCFFGSLVINKNHAGWATYLGSRLLSCCELIRVREYLISDANRFSKREVKTFEIWNGFPMKICKSMWFSVQFAQESGSTTWVFFSFLLVDILISWYVLFYLDFSIR